MGSTQTCFTPLRGGALALLFAAIAFSQVSADSNEIIPVEPITVPSPSVAVLSEERILGVLPTYLVVNPSQNVAPLTKKQKFQLFVKETMDPSTFAAAGVTAALSQSGNSTPRYGVGAGPYGQRLGAAYADIALGNFFSDAVFASVFHQDPRYYRMGPGHSVARRTAYSLSRLFITRQDNGRSAFNISGILGTGLAVGLANAYYPNCNVNGSTVGSHFASNAIGTSVGNLLPEFWPDLKQKFARHHH